MGDWASALLVVSLAALIGAALWLLVHPERPLHDALRSEPMQPETAVQLYNHRAGESHSH